MKVTYIGHSGFLLEEENAYFLFDYYQGEIPVLKKKKPLVVFVSHKHKDHFNPEIFFLLEKYPDTTFVLPKGIPLKWYIRHCKEKGISLENALYIVKKNENYKLPLSNEKNLEITTFRSTDTGVAYLLLLEGKTYYHAGDLHLWVWEGEPEQKNRHMKEMFLVEMEKLKDKKIDVAFVPLDPRLEGHVEEGMEIFLQYTDSKTVFPMHMWGEYDCISDYLGRYPKREGCVMRITKEGQVFELVHCHNRES